MLWIARVLASLMVWALVGGIAHAAPGDILFSDDFEAAGGGCAGFAPDWTTSSTALSGFSTQTSNSPSCSMFTRAGAVTVTGPGLDLSAVAGVTLTAWVRKGADSFSEDPDGAENLVLEAQSSTGSWIALQTFSASALAPGAVTSVMIDLPGWALHTNARIRWRQVSGSGFVFDYWHIDDVVITETGTPPPPPDLTANSCDDFEDGTGNWLISGAGSAGTSSDTAASPSQSLFTRHAAVTVESVPIAAPNVQTLSAWIRRGSDSFSENPEGGENLVVSYFNDVGSWVTLETFGGGGAPGEIFTRSWPLPADARHGGLRIRLEQTAGSGADFDYWHIDDVCLVSGSPDLAASKTVEIEEDFAGSSGDPMSIPGAWVRYSISVSNSGDGVVDDGTVVIRDEIDPNTVFFSGDFDGSGSPVAFIDGAGGDASGLSLVFGGLADTSDGITFLDSAGTPIVPTGGFDPAVRAIELAFDGALAASNGSTTPQFEIRYRAMLD